MKKMTAPVEQSIFDETVDSIKVAVEEAERMAGCEIQSVYVGIAGGHIKGIAGHGMITLRNREVTKRDLERVIESANALKTESERCCRPKISINIAHPFQFSGC